MTEKTQVAAQSFEERLAASTDGNERPIIKPSLDGLTFIWRDYQLLVDAERFGHDGQAELTFWHDNSDYRQLLVKKRVNLLSVSSTTNLVRLLQGASAELNFVPWYWVMECLNFAIIKEARQGEPVETIWPSEDDDLMPAYLLEPILYLNHPTVIFGDYGSVKSTFALVVGYITQLPHPDNNLGLTTLKESTRCLYLDYEDDPLSFRKRWGAIQRGFGIKASMPIEYRRMTTTVADSIDSLQQIKKDKDIKLLIVDSLGPAARGNLNDPEPAIRYHEGLRRLGITSLTLAHNAKDPLTKKRTIFGSVFFTNLARSVWECRSAQETGEDEAIISLKHAKANLSKLHLPLGYKFTFTDKAITIAKADLRDTGLSGQLPLSAQIKNLLRSGAMPVKDIADTLDANEGSVKTTLNRLAKKEITVKVGELWGLKAL